MANEGSTADERDPSQSADQTAEAVQAVVRAAIDVGRQILDAVERALDDPATAERLRDAVAGLSAVTEGMRHGLTPRAGGQKAAGPVEHIPVERIPVDGTEAP